MRSPTSEGGKSALPEVALVGDLQVANVTREMNGFGSQLPELKEAPYRTSSGQTINHETG